MKWIESVIVYLFPAILLEGKPWRMMWEEKEREVFLLICRTTFLFCGVAYIGHYFFYDKVIGLQPLEKWFAFRMIVGGSCLLAAAFYFTPLTTRSYYKIPAVVATWMMSYSQALVVTWWDGTPWLYCFVFVFGSIVVVRTTPLASVALASLYMASQATALIGSGVPLSSFISTSIVTIIIILIVRSSYMTDVKNFVLNQENVAAQKQIIELNIEFADRLRAFIPKVISGRIDAYINENRLPIIQAAVEVLKARRTNVACLFSDIRGFTQGSKDLDSYINMSVLPEMKACSDLVEERNGIPRKVGDLIFAYFDDENPATNVLRALLAAMDIARINQDMNATVTKSEIRRYILVSTGDAIVGNLGGLDSSIEITALGTPVNLLSRIDDLTKEPRLSRLLTPGDVIICDSTKDVIADLGLAIDYQTIALDEIGLCIRDFPETKFVHRLEPTDSNYHELSTAYVNLNNRANVSGLVNGTHTER